MKSREPASTAPIGAPRSLGEIEPDRVAARCHVICALMPVGDTGVHQPRAVHMGGQAVVPWRSAQRRRARPSCQTDAAADIGGLLGTADEALASARSGCAGAARAQVVGPENCPSLAVAAVVIWKPPSAACAPPSLVEDMGGLVREDLVTGPAMGQHGHHVAHRAGRQEHRRLPCRAAPADALAQCVDGGIVAALLVADLRARHRLAHRRASASSAYRRAG